MNGDGRKGGRETGGIGKEAWVSPRYGLLNKEEKRKRVLRQTRVFVPNPLPFLPF
jgi:hypothetical protein